jgi:transcriptional regulator with XRE-family HTH domain
MGIKSQIILEMELRRKLRGDSRMTYKDIARESGVSYSGLMKWVREEGRGIGDGSIDSILGVLGKRVIIVDNDL